MQPLALKYSLSFFIHNNQRDFPVQFFFSGDANYFDISLIVSS